MLSCYCFCLKKVKAEQQCIFLFVIFPGYYGDQRSQQDAENRSGFGCRYRRRFLHSGVCVPCAILHKRYAI